MPLYHLIPIVIGTTAVLALTFALGMYFAPHPFIVDNSTVQPTEAPDLESLGVPQFGKPTKVLFKATDYEVPPRCSGTGKCSGDISQDQPIWLIPLLKNGREIGVVAYCLDCIPPSNGVRDEQ